PRSEGPVSFADDASVIFADTSWKMLRVHVEYDLSILLDWFAVNMLTVNIEKTFFVPFGIRSSSLPEYDNLGVGSENQENRLVVKRVNNIIYHGVLPNKNMRFPTDQLYEKAKVLDIRQMYYLNLAIDVIRWGGEELKKIDHNYQTHKNCPFLIPRITSSKGHKSRSYMVARVFNSLLGDLKKIVHPTKMKKRLGKRMISSKRSILEVYLESDIDIPHDL
ncbi:hypothetical protein HHI36_013697, partial [Cryptolaemus montrouzieri]